MTRGFSMIEILVAVAIVGVVATLASPGLYLSYTRNQIIDSAPLIDVAKKQVAAYWAAGGDMSATPSRRECQRPTGW